MVDSRDIDNLLEIQVGIPRKLWERLGTYNENSADHRDEHPKSHDRRSPPTLREHPIPIGKEALYKCRDDSGLWKREDEAVMRMISYLATSKTKQKEKRTVRLVV